MNYKWILEIIVHQQVIEPRGDEHVPGRLTPWKRTQAEIPEQTYRTKKEMELLINY